MFAFCLFLLSKVSISFRLLVTTGSFLCIVELASENIALVEAGTTCGTRNEVAALAMVSMVSPLATDFVQKSVATEAGRTRANFL